MAQFVITGVKEIDRALQELPGKVAKKVIAQALRKSIKPIAQKAKSNAPVRSGRLKRAIKVRAGKRKKGRISVLVRIGAGDFVGKEFYGSFVEWGSRAHYSRKYGKKSRNNRNTKGGQKPQKFMTRAYDAGKDQARDTAITEIQAGIDQQVKASAR